MTQITVDPYDEPEVLRATADFINELADLARRRGKPQPVPSEAPAEEPPVSVPAPAPEPAPVEPPTSTPLDAAGYPWDERIHSGSRKQNNDGTWKKKRGVPKETVAEVEAELRGAMAGAIGENGFTAAEQQEQDQIAANGESQGQQPSAAAIFGGSPVTEEPQGSQPPPAPTGGLEWPDVMTRIAQAQASGQITPEQLTQVLANHGVNGDWPLLFNRPDAYDGVLQGLGLS